MRKAPLQFCERIMVADGEGEALANVFIVVWNDGRCDVGESDTGSLFLHPRSASG